MKCQVRYLPFVTLQSLVDQAFMWSQSGDSSLLPASQQELCQPSKVNTQPHCCSLEDSLQIYADKGMSYSIKGSLENLDIFQAIQLFLTPLCTVFSFAFTVPLVLKVSMLKYLEYLILILL